MMSLLFSLLDFFVENLPSLRLTLWLFPCCLLWCFLTLYIAGIAKKDWGWPTGYSRKIFHFVIFFSAYMVQVIYDLKGVFILGWSASLVVFYACYKGTGNHYFEALAREKDAPFRTRYILYSYLATLVGGVFSNLFFHEFAIFGYAITGISDAIAEPIGTKYGKHTYRVFSFNQSKISERSIEGSIAVFLSALVISVCIVYTSALFTISFPVLLMIALICALVEAVSPCGFDNAILQWASSALFFYFLSAG